MIASIVPVTYRIISAVLVGLTLCPTVHLTGVEQNKLLQMTGTYKIETLNGENFKSNHEGLEIANLVLIGKEIVLAFPEKSRNQLIFGISAIEDLVQ